MPGVAALWPPGQGLRSPAGAGMQRSVPDEAVFS